MAHQFEKPDVIILGHARSGTHFLEACLASHPKIHKRGECILRFKRNRGDPALHEECLRDHLFINRPNHLNIAIVRYGDVSLLNQLCGPLFEFRVIHLLRAPEDVALSVAQMWADRRLHGKDFKAHYKINEPMRPHGPIRLDELEKLKAKVHSEQSDYIKYLASHANIITLKYEEMTNNEQTNLLPDAVGRRILDFLGLEFCPLRNKLQKTGVSHVRE